MSKQKILITGAAGYLGSMLLPLLAKQGYGVAGFDNYMYGQERKPFVLKKDICDLRDMYESTRGVDVVVALAGIVGDPACGLDEDTTRLVNLESTKLLVEACETNNVKKIIFASSCSVYGASVEEINERSQTNPLSLYAETKQASEKLLLERCVNCEPIILRFGTLYGYSERMRFDLVANIMTAMAIKEGKIVVNGGGQFRPMVHVMDVANVITSFIEQDSKDLSLIYNVSGENYTILDLAKEVAKITGARIVHRQEKTDGRDYNVKSLFLDYKYEYSLARGIKEIKRHFEKGEFKNYKDPKYYNYEILKALSA